MMEASDWLKTLLSADAPALPAAWAMQIGLTLCWALVLALLAAQLSGRLPLALRRALAAGIALWTLLPGPLSPDYWLGLAFHAPSLLAALLCAWQLQRQLFPVHSGRRNAVAGQPSGPLWLLWVGVLLGYGLLLDTFALLPLQLYTWGFSPALLLGLLALALLPWVLRGYRPGSMTPASWVAPCALLLFAATRLPTGNVWDALMDPWLWLLLQVWLIRSLLRRWCG